MFGRFIRGISQGASGLGSFNSTYADEIRAGKVNLDLDTKILKIRHEQLFSSSEIRLPVYDLLKAYSMDSEADRVAAINRIKRDLPIVTSAGESHGNDLESHLVISGLLAYDPLTNAYSMSEEIRKRVEFVEKNSIYTHKTLLLVSLGILSGRTVGVTTSKLKKATKNLLNKASDRL